LLHSLADLYPAASIGVLAWLDDPQQFLPFLLELILFESNQVSILFLGCVAYVEGERHVVEDIVVLFIAEVFEVEEQTLLVGQKAVVLDVVVGHLDGLALLLLAPAQK
jgi:hypothetical protein